MPRVMKLGSDASSRSPIYGSCVRLMPLIVVGALYYLVSVRGRSHDVESADMITGEATIG